MFSGRLGGRESYTNRHYQLTVADRKGRYWARVGQKWGR